MTRDFIKNLVEWKNSSRRKPLILTGVRQCGKTYLLKQFGSEYFEDYCYVNFESAGKYSAIFDYDFDVNRIIREIELIENVRIIPGKTLLIFDEIQECPKAITALKYFCENLQELHLVCAGSLLGVALKQENVSFPVGKVNRMQLYPMSFKEYLMAVGEEKYIELFVDWPVAREIPDIYKIPLERHFKKYLIIGGMPEVVKEFANSGNYTEVAKIQDEILADYADDFSKHAPVSEIEKIRMVWDSIPKQLAKENNKFIFSHVKEGKRAHELEGALQWLKNAGLVHLIEMIQNPEVPLSANADATYFKVYMADSGLLCRKLGVSFKNILEDNLAISTFKGAITENYVLQELVTQNKNPYFWRSGNSAELDFLYEDEENIVPIEVKSATNTQAKSFKQFCKKYHNSKGFKLSLKNIAANDFDGTKVVSLPLYLIWNINSY
ncbi:MAG: ATP-binding protein [Treponema sp.]|nr:ATP-binding protein [Treponema sp.]